MGQGNPAQQQLVGAEDRHDSMGVIHPRQEAIDTAACSVHAAVRHTLRAAKSRLVKASILIRLPER